MYTHIRGVSRLWGVGVGDAPSSGPAEYMFYCDTQEIRYSRFQTHVLWATTQPPMPSPSGSLPY